MACGLVHRRAWWCWTPRWKQLRRAKTTLSKGSGRMRRRRCIGPTMACKWLWSNAGGCLTPTPDFFCSSREELIYCVTRDLPFGLQTRNASLQLTTMPRSVSYSMASLDMYLYESSRGRSVVRRSLVPWGNFPERTNPLRGSGWRAPWSFLLRTHLASTEIRPHLVVEQFRCRWYVRAIWTPETGKTWKLWRLCEGMTVLRCDAKKLIKPSLKSAFVYVQSCPGEWGLWPWFGLSHHWQKEKESSFSPWHVRHSTRARGTVPGQGPSAAPRSGRKAWKPAFFQHDVQGSVQMTQGLNEHRRNETESEMSWSEKREEQSDSFREIPCGRLIQREIDLYRSHSPVCQPERHASFFMVSSKNNWWSSPRTATQQERTVASWSEGNDASNSGTNTRRPPRTIGGEAIRLLP